MNRPITCSAILRLLRLIGMTNGVIAMQGKYLVYPLFAVVLGCSGSDSNTEAQPPQNNVFDTQVEALEKADAVEQQIQDAAARQRRAIDDQSR